MDFLEHMYHMAKKKAATIKINGSRKKPVISFRNALEKEGMGIIAEVKYATPADGDLGIEETPSVLAKEYEKLGASAISCITEEAYFKGAVSYLKEICSISHLPVLMKDFIVDSSQILLGWAVGADAYLLITEMLTLDELKRLYAFGSDLGLDALVEVHSYDGLKNAFGLGAGIIGVNARDLASLEVIPERHEEMIKRIPAGIIKVAESGISSSFRLRRLGEIGYDAVLIGRAMADSIKRKEIFHVGKDMWHNEI